MRITARSRGVPAGRQRLQCVRVLDALDRRPTALYLGLGALGVLLFFLGLNHAPDFDIDGTFYATAGQHIAAHDSISWGTDPVLVHPPLFFLLVAGWLALFGDVHASVLDAMQTTRYLVSSLSIIDGLLTAELARRLTRQVGARRTAATAVAGLLVLTNPFLLRYGRPVLLEPAALLVALLTVRVAIAMWSRSTAAFVLTVGTLTGLACLVKEPAIFVAAAPLVMALVRWRKREIARALGALAVGAVIWLTFVAWAQTEGTLGAFGSQLSVNLQRLVGTVQVSGLNRPGAPVASTFYSTFTQYLGGYLLFGAGLVALIVVIVRRRTRLREDLGACQLVGFGLLSSAYMLYSTLLGASNQQLTIYSLPASALLIVLAGDYPALTPLWRNGMAAGMAFLARGVDLVDLISRRCYRAVAAVAAALILATGVYSWAAFLVPADDATVTVEHYIDTRIPECAPVNATGDAYRWAVTERTHPVTGFTAGPSALAAGVHVFLLSSKDAQNSYGLTSPALATWIRTHGRLVFEARGRTYGTIGVYEVGTVVTPRGATSPSCVGPLPGFATNSSASTFVIELAGVLAVVGALGAQAILLTSRRSETS